MRETTTDKFYKADTKLADWGSASFLSKFWVSTKRGLTVGQNGDERYHQIQLSSCIHHTNPSPIDYRITISINIPATYIQLPMKFQKTSIKLMRPVQNSQIHLKKYRDFQAKQKNLTCLITPHKPISHWLLSHNDHKHFRNFVDIIIESWKKQPQTNLTKLAPNWRIEDSGSFLSKFWVSTKRGLTPRSKWWLKVG